MVNFIKWDKMLGYRWIFTPVWMVKLLSSHQAGRGGAWLERLKIFFEAVEGFSGGSDLVGEARRVWPCFLLDFQRQGNIAAGQRAEEFQSGGPVDGAVVRREMRIFVAQVVVNVGAGDILAHGSKTGGDALFLGVKRRPVSRVSSTKARK